MIFQHTHLQVLSGAKTQTRRIWQEGDYSWIQGELEWQDNGKTKTAHLYSEVYSHHKGHNRLRYRVGSTYAVQAKRGGFCLSMPRPDWKPGDFPVIDVRIKLLSIRREDVRKISEADAFAEGFGSVNTFLATWTSMYDKPAHKRLPNWNSPTLVNDYRVWRIVLDSRPIKRYRAWVLEFELVKEEEHETSAV